MPRLQTFLYFGIVDKEEERALVGFRVLRRKAGIKALLRLCEGSIKDQIIPGWILGPSALLRDTPVARSLPPEDTYVQYTDTYIVEVNH
jgi:hypothetical protein